MCGGWYHYRLFSFRFCPHSPTEALTARYTARFWPGCCKNFYFQLLFFPFRVPPVERLSKDRYKSCLQNSLGGSACPLDKLMWTIAWPSKTSQCWEGLGSSEGCGPKLLLGKGSSWTVKIEESPSPFQRPRRRWFFLHHLDVPWWEASKDLGFDMPNARKNARKHTEEWSSFSPLCFLFETCIIRTGGS